MSKSKYAILIKALVKLAWPTSASGRIKTSPFLTYFVKNDQTNHITADEKFSKHWPPNKTLEEILEEADNLYENEKYIEVYELLNRLKYSNNSNVKWRIARVLYQTTANNVLSLEMETEIIKEAYDLLLEEATEENTNANVHKWFAITCDCRHRLLGIEKRIEGYHTVLKHLRIAYELDPDDITVCYLLGKFCFDMAILRGFKRFVAIILYAKPPECTFQEAHKYLCRVEQLSERKLLANVYLLGRTCYELKQFYKAKHYLSMACCMTPTCECEKGLICKAKQLLSKLDKYTLGKDVLFFNYECPVRKDEIEGENCNDCMTENVKNEAVIEGEDLKVQEHGPSDEDSLKNNVNLS